MKLLVILLATLFSSVSLSENSVNSRCSSGEEFLPYKAGIEVEKEGLNSAAFDVYCKLAYKGDYRAQFKIAKYYYSGIQGYIDVDLDAAYVWARISNNTIKSRKRKNFILGLKEVMDNADELDQTHGATIQTFPSGKRIDVEYKPLNVKRMLRRMEERRKYTGSNIKRDEPSQSLKIFR